jgi:hypothetical protein
MAFIMIAYMPSGEMSSHQNQKNLKKFMVLPAEAYLERKPDHKWGFMTIHFLS